jgi:hypothetical protein
MKKLIRKMSFNDYADKAAANYWRSRCWTEKWRKAPDSKVLAKIRMRNQNLDGYGHGYAEPTFRCLTDCKSGFFNILIEVNDTPGQRSKEIEKKAGVKSLAMTLRRLRGAGLIESKLDSKGIITWHVTELGMKYLDAAFREFEIC